MRLLQATLLIFLSASSLLAWGEKGHSIANEAATFGTPAAMPAFFHRAYPQIIYLGYNPDRWRGAGVSLDAVNGPNHFLDYEYVGHLKLPPNRYQFIDLLYTSGTLRRFGIENTTSGFVPWRVAEISEQLTNQWRLWRSSDPASIEQNQIEQEIIFLSGILGHFVSDSANPHHASINFNGWVLENPQRYPNDCETHGRFETQFVSKMIVAMEVFPQVKSVVPRTDYFTTALDLIKDSRAQIETIYRIDRDGGFTGKGTSEGRNFAVGRLATGASILRDLWYSAYLNSEAPPPSLR